jgi:hypothetical protein
MLPKQLKYSTFSVLADLSEYVKTMVCLRDSHYLSFPIIDFH